MRCGSCWSHSLHSYTVLAPDRASLKFGSPSGQRGTVRIGCSPGRSCFGPSAQWDSLDPGTPSSPAAHIVPVGWPGYSNYSSYSSVDSSCPNWQLVQSSRNLTTAGPFDWQLAGPAGCNSSWSISFRTL